eukprot:418136_1
MSSDTWGSRSHSNRNPDDNRTNNNDQLTTTTITSLSTNTTNNASNTNHIPTHSNDNINRSNRPYHSHGTHNNNYRRNNNIRHRRISRSRSYSKSRSRSRSRSHSINDSLSRSPTPKKRNISNRHDHNRDHIRKRNGSRTYHSRRPKRHTRELPYPSRSRSRSTSKSRSPLSRSKSRSLSYSNDSDDGRRHRRHNRKRPMGRDNRYKHRHGHGDGRNGMRRRRNMMGRGNNNQMYNNNNNNMYDRNDRHMRMNNKRNNMMNMHNNNNNNTNDKVPVSFKEFTNTMLEDDVTASEAQKRYEKYLQRFSKSDDVLFFEAHKDEEWFQERYDPIIIEKSIESRREHARINHLKFYEEFVTDSLPEIHDNISDFKSLGNEIHDKIASPTEEIGEEEDVNMTTTTTVTSKENKKIEELRLPKYVDIMYRDDYIFNINKNVIEYSESECYENSIFIQGIPLHIQRCKIYLPFSKCLGFLKLILSDPIRNSRKVRYGWVTFDSQINCRRALLDVSEGGLNGHQLTGQYFMNLLPKQKSKRRPKFSPPESLYPHRVNVDFKQTLKCCTKFDSEAGINSNPLLNCKLLLNLSLIRKLNLLLLYLRRIHFLCYYCGKHFLSEEHMYARCSGTHERKVPADPSLSISGNISLLNDKSQTIIKKEKTNWEKDLDSRINDVINYEIDHKHCWIERKQIKMLEKNSKKISDGKFRCTICSKLFKAEIYVIKHIKNKHQDEIAKYIADQRLRTMFENYRRDRDRLTCRSFEDNNQNNNNNNNKDNNKKHQHTMHPQQPPPINPMHH